MIKKTQIRLNENVFNAMIEVMSDNICPHEHINDYERVLFDDLTFKNAVFYIADNSAKGYSGQWRVAHLIGRNLPFLHLDTEDSIDLYSPKIECKGSIESTTNIDGRIFGLLMSLQAYRFLYFASKQRGNNAEAITYNDHGYRMKKAINDYIRHHFETMKWCNLNSNDKAEIWTAIELINHHTKKDYAM